MVDPSCEIDLGRAKGIISWKLYVEEEDSAFVGTAIGANHRRLPVEQIFFSDGASTDIVYRILVQVQQFFLNPLKSHLCDYSLHCPEFIEHIMT